MREREREREREGGRFQNHYLLALAGDNAEIKLKPKNYLYVIIVIALTILFFMVCKPNLLDGNLTLTLYWSGSFVKFLVVSGNNQSASLKSLGFTLFSGPEVYKQNISSVTYISEYIYNGCLKKNWGLLKKWVKVHLDWSKEFITAKKKICSEVVAKFLKLNHSFFCFNGD